METCESVAGECEAYRARAEDGVCDAWRSTEGGRRGGAGRRSRIGRRRRPDRAVAAGRGLGRGCVAGCGLGEWCARVTGPKNPEEDEIDFPGRRGVRRRAHAGAAAVRCATTSRRRRCLELCARRRWRCAARILSVDLLRSRRWHDRKAGPSGAVVTHRRDRARASIPRPTTTTTTLEGRPAPARISRAYRPRSRWWTRDRVAGGGPNQSGPRRSTERRLRYRASASPLPSSSGSRWCSRGWRCSRTAVARSTRTAGSSNGSVISGRDKLARRPNAVEFEVGAGGAG